MDFGSGKARFGEISPRCIVLIEIGRDLDLIKARSSQSTHIKIEIRQLARAWIRARPESAGVRKLDRDLETGSWVEAKVSRSTQGWIAIQRLDLN